MRPPLESVTRARLARRATDDRSPPALMGGHPLLGLQRQAGNQGVQRLLQRDEDDQDDQVPPPPVNSTPQSGAEGAGGSGGSDNSGPQSNTSPWQADWDERHAQDPNPNMGTEGAAGSGTDVDRQTGLTYGKLGVIGGAMMLPAAGSLALEGGMARAMQAAQTEETLLNEGAGPASEPPTLPRIPVPEGEPPTLPRIPAGKPPSPYADPPRIGFGRNPYSGGGPPGQFDDPPRIGFGRGQPDPDPGAPKSPYSEDPKIGF